MHRTRLLPFALACLPGLAADSPQFARAWSRNFVSDERGLTAAFNPADGTGLKWVAELGNESHGTPVVANGRVYQGTNNNRPRDPRHQGDRGVLMCLDEKTGDLLWQLVTPKLDPGDIYKDWPNSGICSPPTVEGDRVYAVSNRGEVLCLDPQGLANGNDGPYQDEGRFMTPPGQPEMTPGPLDADILWRFSLVEEAGVYPHDNAHSAILIHGPYLYLNSGTGVDNTHKKIRLPDAPSLVVLDKATGRFLGREDEGIGPNIFHCTWAGPSLCDVGGKPRVFLAAGNGFVYGFDPLPFDLPAGPPVRFKSVWKYDFDPAAPKQDVHRFVSNKLESPSNFFGMPVVRDGRLFIAGGGDIWWGKNGSWVKCVDLATGAEIWSHALGKHTMSTPTVHDGLVYVTDTTKTLHCLDAATGAGVWTHELKGEIWASPFVADGKVHLGSRKGDFVILRAGREKQVLFTHDFPNTRISATTVAANGVLYIATMDKLYAVR